MMHNVLRRHVSGFEHFELVRLMSGVIHVLLRLRKAKINEERPWSIIHTRIRVVFSLPAARVHALLDHSTPQCLTPSRPDGRRTW